MRRKHSITLFLLIFGVILVSSCEKESRTVVNGTVKDKMTGNAIEGAAIGFNIKHNENTSSGNEYKNVYSDLSGKFSTENDSPISFFDIKKNGYVSKGGSDNFISIDQHHVNDLIIEMIPKDGHISFNVENLKSYIDSVYVTIYSPVQHVEGPISSGIILRKWIKVESNTIKNEVVDLASEEFATIYWGANAFMPFTNAPFKDSIFLLRDDTVNFTIHF